MINPKANDFIWLQNFSYSSPDNSSTSTPSDNWKSHFRDISEDFFMGLVLILDALLLIIVVVHCDLQINYVTGRESFKRIKAWSSVLKIFQNSQNDFLVSLLKLVKYVNRGGV